MDALQFLDDVDLDLVTVGAADPKVFSEPRISRNRRRHDLGYVSDSQLRVLYENALCFVFPSLYEGFGIPPLEAMACGCPVIVARTSTLPESCGDCALLLKNRRLSGRSGDHRPQGMIFARSRSIRPGQIPRIIPVIDFAPTFGALLGLELQGIDGQPVPELCDRKVRLSNESRFSPADAALALGGL
jgi:glycosyl transferase family 1